MRIPSSFESGSKPERYTAGETIFEAGQPGTVMYIVRAGEVDLKIEDRVVETVKPEGFFGEMALLDNAPRRAAAIARTGCELVPLDQERFLFMVDETPFFAIEVMQTMSARLRRKGAQV